jgi:hypothetical protein
LTNRLSTFKLICIPIQLRRYGLNGCGEVLVNQIIAGLIVVIAIFSNPLAGGTFPMCMEKTLCAWA